MMWMTDMTSAWEHLLQFTFMAVVLSTHALTRRDMYRRSRDELRRLRFALRISLRALRELYDDNLRILASDERLLLSGRSQIGLLRIQWARLLTLDEVEIQALLAANIAMEGVEAAMAIAGKLATGAVGFTIPRESAAEVLKLQLIRTCAALESAEALLAVTGAPLPPSVETAASIVPLPSMAEAD